MRRLWLPPLIAHVSSWAAFFGVVSGPGILRDHRNPVSGRKREDCIRPLLPRALHAISGPWGGNAAADAGSSYRTGGLAGAAAGRPPGTDQNGAVGAGNAPPGVLFYPNLVSGGGGDRIYLGSPFTRSGGIDYLSDYSQRDQTNTGWGVGTTVLLRNCRMHRPMLLCRRVLHFSLSMGL